MTAQAITQDHQITQGRNPQLTLGRARGGLSTRIRADHFADSVRFHVCLPYLHGLGLTAIARDLNDKGISGDYGGSWSPQSVKNVLLRLGVYGRRS